MSNKNTQTTRLLTVKDAANYLAISERKLWSMTQTGEIPAVRLGRAVRYDINDLDSFIQRAKRICQTEL
jgi:excisionase family DNA binding protein